MTDRNENSALQASFRGALGTSAALEAWRERIEALDPDADLPAEDLEELGRITAAHAIASAALRGLVTTMMDRRGVASASRKPPSEA
ncbi:MAG TPA: hypothetical protein VLD67_07590 [Vicinamibacterales bacterium]|nr:hypothetical protein [Vicinamibacterales bacterium]